MRVPADLCHELYAGVPKVIVSGDFDGAAFPEEMLAAVRPLALIEASRRLVLSPFPAQPGEDDVELVPVDVPPCDTLVLWASTADARAALTKLASWWRKHGDARTVPAVMTGDLAALRDFLLQWAAQENRALNAQLDELRETLVVLRQEHEQTRQVLLELNARVVDSIDSGLRMTHVGQPLRRQVRASVDGAVSQRLFGPTKGLVGIDVHLGDMRGATGELQCVLTSNDAGESLGSWAVAVDAVDEGWLHLPLPRALTESLQDVVLTIFPVVGDGAAAAAERGTRSPGLSTSRTNLDARYWVRIGEAANDLETLALRTWHGVPGLAYHRPAAVPRATARESLVYSLDSSAWHQARLLREFEVDFTVFGYYEGEGLLLHPVQGEETLAVLEAVVPPECTSVKTWVTVNDESRSPVEFAMFVAPATVAVEELASTIQQFPSSGWAKVPGPGEKHLLEVSLDGAARNARSAHSVILSTRVAGGASVDYARAVFTEMQIECSMTAAIPAAMATQPG